MDKRRPETKKKGISGGKRVEHHSLADALNAASASGSTSVRPVNPLRPLKRRWTAEEKGKGKALDDASDWEADRSHKKSSFSSKRPRYTYQIEKLPEGDIPFSGECVHEFSFSVYDPRPVLSRSLALVTLQNLLEPEDFENAKVESWSWIIDYHATRECSPSYLQSFAPPYPFDDDDDDDSENTLEAHIALSELKIEEKRKAGRPKGSKNKETRRGIENRPKHAPSGSQHRRATYRKPSPRRSFVISATSSDDSERGQGNRDRPMASILKLRRSDSPRSTSQTPLKATEKIDRVVESIHLAQRNNNVTPNRDNAANQRSPGPPNISAASPLSVAGIPAARAHLIGSLSKAPNASVGFSTPLPSRSPPAPSSRISVGVRAEQVFSGVPLLLTPLAKPGDAGTQRHLPIEADTITQQESPSQDKINLPGLSIDSSTYPRQSPNLSCSTKSPTSGRTQVKGDGTVVSNDNQDGWIAHDESLSASRSRGELSPKFGDGTIDPSLLGGMESQDSQAPRSPSASASTSPSPLQRPRSKYGIISRKPHLPVLPIISYKRVSKIPPRDPDFVDIDQLNLSDSESEELSSPSPDSSSHSVVGATSESEDDDVVPPLPDRSGQSMKTEGDSHFCHQCRRKTARKHMVCSSCSFYFCYACIDIR